MSAVGMRLTLFALGLGCVFVSPWLALLCVIFLSIGWRAYEVLFIGLLVDFTWSAAGTIPAMTIAAIAIVLGLEPLRERFFRA